VFSLKFVCLGADYLVCFSPVLSHNLAMCVRNVKLRGLQFCVIGGELDYVVLHLGAPGIKPFLGLTSAVIVDLECMSSLCMKL
jgi:hypothetical protein